MARDSESVSGLRFRRELRRVWLGSQVQRITDFAKKVGRGG